MESNQSPVKPFHQKTREEQIDIISEQVFRILKLNNKPMERSMIKEKLLSENTIFRDYSNEIRHGKTGDLNPFDIPFSFSFTNLKLAGLINAERGKEVSLTEKGNSISIQDFDVMRDVRELANAYWRQKHKENRERKKLEKETKK